ncbi:hypothetical protein ACB098_12G169400 [Castanea mollissima]
MDFCYHILTILGLFTLTAIFIALNSKSNTKRGYTKCIEIPEPSGALPIIGHLHLLGGQEPMAKILGAIADKYGSFFSLKMGIHRMLVVSSWEMVKEFLATHDNTFATRASIAVGEHLFNNNAIFALAPYGQYWRDVRKMATLEIFSSHSLEKLKHVRFSEVKFLIKNLHLLCINNKVVTISELFEHMAFNIILWIIVGKRFSTTTYGEEKSEACRFRSAIKEALHLLVAGHVSSMKRTAKELDSVLEIWLAELLQKRLEQKSDGESDFMNLTTTFRSDGESDFMNMMLSNFPRDVEISGHTRDVVVKATALILVFTGAGSTSTTLTWAISLLLNHPSVLKAAQEELDMHVGKDKWVEESDIKNLKYLDAIVKETLRLYPPGPLTGIREAMEDCTVGGYYVPKGTRLLINILKLQRDPRVWSNPSEFQPERFMTTHADIDVWGQNFEYIPFSSGRRSCPGITFGLQVVHLALARVLQGFDITTMASVKVDMLEGPGISLPKVNPLDVVLKPRLPMESY